MIRNQKAFTLVELAIALAVIGLVVLGVFQLTASMGRQASDRQIASELKSVTDAAQAYLAQVGNTNLATGTTSIPGLTIPALAVSNSRVLSDQEINFIETTYLPGGTDLNTPSGANAPYRIALRRLADVNGTPAFQALVVNSTFTNAASPQNPNLSDSRGATIAAQSGANGGYVYRGANIISGSKGSWSVGAANFGNLITPTPGMLASLVNSSGIAVTSNMLSRLDTGNEAANRMSAALITSEGVRFEVPATTTPLIAGGGCGVGVEIAGLKPNSKVNNVSQGYPGRMVLGRSSASKPDSQVILVCSTDNGTSYTWRDVQSPVIPSQTTANLFPDEMIHEPWSVKSKFNMGPKGDCKTGSNVIFGKAGCDNNINRDRDPPEEAQGKCFWTLGTGGEGWVSYQICPNNYYVAGASMNGADGAGVNWAQTFGGTPNGRCGSSGEDCLSIMCCPFSN